MTELEKLEHDLSYVRTAVSRSDKQAAPKVIYLLWAAIVLVGFPLADFAPERMGLFWLIAAPVGWVISIVLGARAARHRGQYDSRQGLRHAAHWGVMLATVFLAALMPARGMTAWDALGPITLLIVAAAYLLAAIHLDRLMLWPGVMMGVGYAILLLGVGYTWTTIGVLVSGGLVVSSYVGGRRRAVEA